MTFIPGTKGAAEALDYRRPVLEYVSATQVDVENNTGTANETEIIFPDGDRRAVTEDTSLTNQYRRFDITATASLTATHDSGLRSTLSEATNTWYAIYAVKTTDDDTKFVLSGDTTFPTQSNYSTLNTRYGTDGWVFLGYIRNGDNQATTGDILKFYQVKNRILFSNVTANSPASQPAYGTRLATTGGATTLTWTYSAGGSGSDVPGTLTTAIFLGAYASVTGKVIRNAAGTVTISVYGDPSLLVGHHPNEMNIKDGIQLQNGPSSSIAQAIYLVGFVDGHLS